METGSGSATTSLTAGVAGAAGLGVEIITRVMSVVACRRARRRADTTGQAHAFTTVSSLFLEALHGLHNGDSKKSII